jgi:hypothetical protein
VRKDSFSVDDLPRFSPWPARLLGLEPWRQRRKSRAQVTREYEQEKWGPLLQRYLTTGATADVATVFSWSVEGIDRMCCIDGDRLQLLSSLDANRRLLEIVEDTIRPYLPAPALAELGAGFGNVILNVALAERARCGRLLAGEYTPSGVELIRRLSAAAGFQVDAGLCDFSASKMTVLPIPSDAVIFTCFAAHYVRILPDSFVEFLCELAPRLVVHFEPCYEHCDGESLLGLMQRRYIELNDYNRNLVTLLRTYEKKGWIVLLGERPHVFGTNPFLPLSILLWRPARSAGRSRIVRRRRHQGNEA